MRPVTFTLISIACAGACSSTKHTTPDAGDTGFRRPTAALRANKEVSDNNWVDQGAADLSCLGTPSSDQATTVAVTLSTVVKDFQSGNAVPLANVTAYDNQSFDAPFDTEMADGNGMITFHVPTGRKRFGFKLTTSDGQTMPTFLLNQYIDPGMATQTLSKIQSVSQATAATLPALIGETRQPGSGVLAGALRDCQLHEMSNFIATVSSTSHMATPLTGAETYYFSASVGLPVHHKSQEAASQDGLFMVIQLPPTPTAFVQMWGYKSDADVTADNLTLLSELQVPVLADNVITGSYELLRQ
jgi:hypothetical protein